MTLTIDHTPATVAELVAAITAQRQRTARTTWPTEPAGAAAGPERVAQEVQLPIPVAAQGADRIVVAGVEPGVGTSIVALLVAEALVACGASPNVRLIDLAPATPSGLSCAVDRQLGTDESGCGIGLRGSVEIRRLGVTDGIQLPTIEAEAGYLDVLDVGTAPGGVAGMEPTAWVVVCHATVPGVRRAEQVLERLPGTTAVVAAVAAAGSRRWPGAVQASMGSQMRALVQDGRVVLVPRDRRLSINGIDTDPLPKALAAAGDLLADLLWPQSRSEAAAREPKSMKELS